MTTSRWRRVRRVGLLACLLAGVAVVFGGTLDHGFVNYDDLTQIVENPLVTRPASVPVVDRLLTPSHSYIVPVTAFVQGALWQLGGGAPVAFHACGLLLHALLVFTVFLIIERVGNQALAPLLGSVFAVHPVVAEPVAWATGLKDLLAAVFAVGATLAFVRGTTVARHALRWQLCAGGLLLMAMLSKPTTVLLGASWLGYWLATGRRDRGGLVAIAVLLLGLLLGLLSRWTHDAAVENADWSRERWSVWLPFSVLGRQALNLVWPLSLHPSYHFTVGPPWADWKTALGLVLSAVLGWLLVRSRTRPVAWLALSGALLVYLPVSNVLPFGRRMADSYLYLPLVGAVVCLADALRHVSVCQSLRWTALPSALFGLLLGLRAHAQSERWRDSETLWIAAARAMPEAPEPRAGLASAYLVQGEFEAAIQHYQAVFARRYRKGLLGDFGVALARVGRIDEAECVMLEATLVGNEPIRSLRNFAIFVARDPERPFVFPDEAHALLRLAIHSAASGRISLDRRSLARLQKRAARGPVPAEPLRLPRWSEGRCPILRPRHAVPGRP